MHWVKLDGAPGDLKSFAVLPCCGTEGKENADKRQCHQPIEIGKLSILTWKVHALRVAIWSWGLWVQSFLKQVSSADCMQNSAW